MPKTSFTLDWTHEAEANYNSLKLDASKKKQYKAVKKTLTYLATNPRHNSLNCQPYYSFKGPKGETVWEAYAEQNTPAAYRVFWYYGPSRGMITILTITPHP